MFYLHRTLIFTSLAKTYLFNDQGFFWNRGQIGVKSPWLGIIIIIISSSSSNSIIIIIIIIISIISSRVRLIIIVVVVVVVVVVVIVMVVLSLLLVLLVLNWRMVWLRRQGHGVPPDPNFFLYINIFTITNKLISWHKHVYLCKLSLFTNELICCLWCGSAGGGMVCMYTRMCRRVCMYIGVCVYIYIYISLYTYIYIYIMYTRVYVLRVSTSERQANSMRYTVYN